MGPSGLVAGSRLEQRRWLIVTMIVLAVLGQAALATIAQTLGDRAPDQLRVFFEALAVAAILTIPAVAFVAWIDRRERESPWLYAFALGWGMLGATGLSIALNGMAVRDVFHALSAAQSGAVSPDGLADTARLLTAIFLGPPIEELTKAIALLLLAFLLRGQFFTMHDGIVFGLLVGLGFNLLEVPFYVMNGYADVGVVPWDQQVIARFVFLGINGHALFTALFGAGIGYFLQRGGMRGVLGAIGGAAAGILAHMAHNGLVGLAMLLMLMFLGHPMPYDMDAATFVSSLPDVVYWLAVALATLLVLWWAYLLLAILLIRSARYEARTIQEQLKDEIGRTITAEEYAGVTSEERFGLRTIPGLDRRASLDLVNAQNKLALLKARAIHLGRDPETDPQVLAWRTEIARLRTAG